MIHFLKTISAAALVAGLSLAPSFGGELSPEGSWESVNGETRFEVSLCGDGTQLCAVLTWLSDDAKTEENLALLNTYVVKGAQLADEYEWEGKVSFDGKTHSGSIRLISADTIKLRGCSGILCRSFDFRRI